MVFVCSPGIYPLLFVLNSLPKSAEEMHAWIDAIDAALPLSRCAKYSVVQDVVGCLFQRGVQKEGIFRVPGNLNQIKKLMTSFVAGENLALDQILNPHTLAQFLKRLFKEEVIDPVISKQSQMLLHQAFKGE